MVLLKLPGVFQVGGKTGDGHVGDAVEVVEIDVKILLQRFFVIGFEFGLVRRKESSIWVIDEVKLEFGVSTVTDGIEFLESENTRIEDAFTSLLIDVIGLITGHRGDDLDLVLTEEVRHPFITRFVDDRCVEAIHDPARLVKMADGFHQASKVGDHLWSAAGEVESGDGGFFEPLQDPVDGFAVHDFLSLWPGVHMAVNAGQVAELSNVELEDFRSSPLQGGIAPGQSLIKFIEWFQSQHFGERRLFLVVPRRLIQRYITVHSKNKCRKIGEYTRIILFF